MSIKMILWAKCPECEKENNAFECSPIFIDEYWKTHELIGYKTSFHCECGKYWSISSNEQ